MKTDQIRIVALFSALYLVMLGGSYLWDWDETVYAAAAKQMYERDDWIVPIVTYRDDGTPFYGDKPILMYWGMILSFHVFGTNEFAARFPSAVYGILSLLLVYQLTCRLFQRHIARKTVLVLGTMILYAVEARAVTTDATLMFWTTAALLCYVCGVYKPPDRPDTELRVLDENYAGGPEYREEGVYFPKSYRCCLLLYFCLGMAFLDKGPVGVVLPMAVLGMFMLIKRLPPLDKPRAWPLRLLRPFHPLHFLRTVWAMRPVTAIVVMSLVAGPWYLAVHRATGGAWTHLFFGVHNFDRATAAMEGHGYPLDFLWYYPASLLAITFPWSLFFAPALLHTIRRLRLGTPFRDGYCFAICWACVYMGVFSLVDTKMPNYIFISSAGAAILYAAFLDHWTSWEDLVSPRWTLAVIGTLVIVALLVQATLSLFLIPVLVPNGRLLYLIPAWLLLMAGVALHYYRNGERKPEVPAADKLQAVDPVLAETVRELVQNGRLFKRFQRMDARAAVLNVVTVMAVGLVILALHLGAYVVSRQQDYTRMFRAVEAECPDPVYRSFDQFEPSWVFYGNRPVTRVGANRIDRMQAFFDEYPENGYVITCSRKFEEKLNPAFENELRIVAAVPYFLKLEKTPRGFQQRKLVVATMGPRKKIEPPTSERRETTVEHVGNP